MKMRNRPNEFAEWLEKILQEYGTEKPFESPMNVQWMVMKRSIDDVWGCGELNLSKPDGEQRSWYDFVCRCKSKLKDLGVPIPEKSILDPEGYDLFLSFSDYVDPLDLVAYVEISTGEYSDFTGVVPSRWSALIRARMVKSRIIVRSGLIAQQVYPAKRYMRS